MPTAAASQTRSRVGQPTPTAFTARERLSPLEHSRRCGNTLVDNDPSAQIPAAYIAKEELRQLLSAAADCADDAEIRTRLPPLQQLGAPRRKSPKSTARCHDRDRWPAILAFCTHGLDPARPHRGLQPAGQTGQTRRLRLPQHRELTPPDTLPLHLQPSGPAPDSPPRTCPVNFEEPE